MTEIDLSLLTGEEREIWENANNHHVGHIATELVRGLLRALIAARAENKRKDEVIGKLSEHLLDTVSESLRAYSLQNTLGEDGEHLQLVDALTPFGDSTVENGLSELELLADHIAADVAALLQSEKGGE